MFHIVASVYDFVVWLLPQLSSNQPEKASNARIFTIHHVIVIYLNALNMPYCSYSYYSLGIGMLEGTGVFVGLFRLSQHLKIPNETPWLIATVLGLFASWTVFRVIMPGYHFYVLFFDVTTAPHLFMDTEVVHLFWSAMLAYLVLTLMSLSWYIKICKKILKTARSMFARPIKES